MGDFITRTMRAGEVFCPADWLKAEWERLSTRGMLSEQATNPHNTPITSHPRFFHPINNPLTKTGIRTAIMQTVSMLVESNHAR
ncbi:hypothetical protein [Laribacter hongkongensis]|uniref:hypothetical protein n=1 Tax=Laribacter hongkongensis TaxID=168471 RepID=UPI0013747362|nr:hypothetical protein [Laribacter hongkongensis]MCG9066652.1 hypothetical protein [Laribacter hongkongensis]